MKKLASLTLALLMCLCTLLPAAAQGGPLLLEDFKADYTTVFSANLPEYSLTWLDGEADGVQTCTALMDGALPMCIVLVEDGYVTTIGVIHQGSTGESDVSVFLVMCALVGSALKVDANPDTGAILTEAADEAYNFLLGDLNGTLTDYTLWGYAADHSFTPLGDGTGEYCLILNLAETPAE